MRSTNSLGSTLFRLVWASLAALLLAGCTSGALSIEARTTLYAEERWQVQIELVYARAVYDLAGDQLDQGLRMQAELLSAQGIQVSYTQKRLRGGNVRYRLNASGQGYERLNATFFDGQATIQVDQSQDPAHIVFSYPPFGTYFGAALSRSFTLKGGRILSSNGVQTRNAVTWRNPLEVMQATLTPAPRLNAAPLLALLGGAGGIALLGLVLSRTGKKSCPYCGARNPRRADYCPLCGEGLRSWAWQS